MKQIIKTRRKILKKQQLGVLFLLDRLEEFQKYLKRKDKDLPQFKKELNTLRQECQKLYDTILGIPKE